MVCIPGGKGIGQYRHIKTSRRNRGDAQRRVAQLAARGNGKQHARRRLGGAR